MPRKAKAKTEDQNQDQGTQEQVEPIAPVVIPDGLNEYEQAELAYLEGDWFLARTARVKLVEVQREELHKANQDVERAERKLSDFLGARKGKVAKLSRFIQVPEHSSIHDLYKDWDKPAHLGLDG